MVESHGGITLATLRDVNLDKRCVALPRYIVYVYIQTPYEYFSDFGVIKMNSFIKQNFHILIGI